MNRKIKMAHKLAMLSGVIFVIVMGAFYFINDSQLTNNIRDNVISSMTTTVMREATIVEKYMQEAEAYLLAYSRAGEVTNLLKNPTDAEAQKLAQIYTENYGKDRMNLEGIYMSEWNTQILTHTDLNVVGMITRKDPEPLKQLHDALDAHGNDKVYNTGIINSPATGLQIISMYKGVYDENGEPLGLVGAGIFTNGLKEVLGALPINGMPNAKGYLINANTNKFIFHDDETLIGTQTPYGELLSQVVSDTNNPIGFVEVDERIISYCVMPTRGWVYVVTDTADEMFASVNVTKNIIKWLTIVAVLLLMVFTFIMITIAMKPLTVLEKALLKLSNYDITEDSSFEKYVKRKDEVGGIATAVKTLLEQYGSIIPTIKNASAMLKGIASELSISTGIASETCDQMALAIEQVAKGAVSQAEDTTKASSNIMCMSDELTKINSNTEDLQSISVSMDSAKKQAVNTLAELQKATVSMIEDVNNTSEQVKVTSESMKGIKDAIGMIDKIASQTHLLSLNASIEASKAGEQGRGFSVVASEMGKLSKQSAEYSSEIKKIIADIEKNYELIIKNVNTTNENMLVQSGKLTDTQRVFTALEGNISDTVERIASINIMVETLSGEISEIVDMLSNLSAISQENSASTDETMAGIEELNTIIIQVNEKATVVNDSADTLIEEVGVFKVE